MYASLFFPSRLKAFVPAFVRLVVSCVQAQTCLFAVIKCLNWPWLETSQIVSVHISAIGLHLGVPVCVSKCFG